MANTFQKPRHKKRFCAWFFAFLLLGCDAQNQPQPPTLPEKTNDAPIAKRTLPDLSAKTVITTSTIAIKNHAQYTNLKHLPYANPHAPKGGVLTMSAQGTFNSLNPFIDEGTPATGAFYLYDTLMTGSLDEAFVLYPQLAQAVTYDENDGSWVIYHLNPQARFWDGSKVHAIDVKATFDAILTDGLMTWRSFLTGIEHIDALDDERVIFYFDKSANPNLFANVGLMPVFAKSSIEQNFHRVSLTPLMGSGAYQVGKIDPARAIEYVRDPNYWAADGQAGVMANVGRFNFDVIKFNYYQDDLVALEALRAGQFNFRTEYDIRHWANFHPTAQSINLTKQKIPHSNPVTMQGLVMNIRRDKLADKRIRQALLFAFDWEWANQRLFYGEYQRLTSFFHGSVLAAVGQPSAKELTILQSLSLNDDEQSALAGITKLPISQADGINRDNLLQARQLLQRAGCYYVDGKLYTADGERFNLEILIQDDKHTAMLLAYLHHLKRLGIDARLRKLDASGYLHKKRHFDYDMIIDNFLQGNSPAAEQAYLWGSKAADEIGSQNSIGIKSPAIDEIITQLTHADERDDIISLTKVLDRLLLAGNYIIPFGGQSTTNVLYHGIRPPDRLPQASIGLDYWYVDTHNDSSAPHKSSHP